MKSERKPLLVGENDVVETQQPQTNMDDLVNDVYQLILLHLDAVSVTYLAISNKNNFQRIKDLLSEPVFNLMLKKVMKEDEQLLKKMVYGAFWETYCNAVKSVKKQNRENNSGLKSKSNQIKLSFGAVALLLMAGTAYLTMSETITKGVAAKNFFALVKTVDKLLSDCEKMFCKKNETVAPSRWCEDGPPTVCGDSANNAKAWAFGCDEQLREKMQSLEGDCRDNEQALGNLIIGWLPLLPILAVGSVACYLTTWKVLECVTQFDAESVVNKLPLDALDFTIANGYLQQEVQRLKACLASVTDELAKFEIKRSMVICEENPDFKKMLNRLSIQLDSTVGQVKKVINLGGRNINQYTALSTSPFGMFLEMKKQNHTVISIPNENTPLLKSGNSF